MEAVVLHRVGFLEYFCPKQGQDFKPSAAPLYPNMGQVPPPPPPPGDIPQFSVTWRDTNRARAKIFDGLQSGMFPSVMGNIRSHDVFTPITREGKYLMDYNCQAGSTQIEADRSRLRSRYWSY